MGLADRDYMRERHCGRQGSGPGGKKAKDHKTPVELDDGIPLGSGSRIGKPGPWFEGKNRGFDYQKGRWRTRSWSRSGAGEKWITALFALTLLIPAYREAKRHGWFPDLEPAVAFPSSGSVTVARNVDPQTATSRLRVQTDKANAVVQLYDHETDAHVISVYVGRDDDVTVPVPPGTYRMQLVEGDKWHGPTRYFGSSTTTDTVTASMQFDRRATHGIDLHRRPDGNLHTRPNLNNPKPLD